jgi:polar amino acid transport system substrate-binding protein
LVFKDFADIRGHTLAAWQGASIQLGSDFYNKLVKGNPNYYECPDQKSQYQMFVQHHVEVLILDKEIFNWWDQRNPKREPVIFHQVFKKANNVYIGFRDPKIRDIFNAGLARIRQTGEWDRVFKKYDVESPPPEPAASANQSP